MFASDKMRVLYRGERIGRSDLDLLSRAGNENFACQYHIFKIIFLKKNGMLVIHDWVRFHSRLGE